MKVRELMSTPVTTVHEDTPFRDIAQLLVDGPSGVPVISSEGRVIGMVTEGDLLAREAFPHGEKRRLARLATFFFRDTAERLATTEHLTAKDVMSHPAVVVAPGASVREAARLLQEQGLKRLPVVEDGVLVGIISRHDVLQVFTIPDEQLQGVVEDFLRRCLYVAPDHDVHVAASGGTITLTGTVRFESDTRVVVELVSSVDGVVNVDSELTFREPDPRVISENVAPWGMYLG